MSTTRNNRRSPSAEAEGSAPQVVMQIETRKRKRRNSGNSDEFFSDYGLTPTESSRRIRIGKDHQAEIPQLLANVRLEDISTREICLWSPTDKVQASQLEDFVNIAKEKFGYSTEQAMGILRWHKFNIEKALDDMPNYVPLTETWSAEERVLFEQAFSFQGKHFHRIKQMLPDKTVGSLVSYYYGWKKSRYLPSYIDRNALKKQTQGDDSEVSDNGEQGGGNSKQQQKCVNCDSRTHTVVRVTAKGLLCTACMDYWKQHKQLRPVTNVQQSQQKSDSAVAVSKASALNPDGPYSEKGTKCPRKINMDLDDLALFNTDDPNAGEKCLEGLRRQLNDCRRKVQANKQLLELNRNRLKNLETEDLSVDVEKIAEEGRAANRRANYKWQPDEMKLAIQGFRRYGKDYAAIAEVVGQKSEAHVRSFYQSYKDRYKLDKLVDEFNKDLDKQKIDQKVVCVDVEDDEEDEADEKMAVEENNPEENHPEEEPAPVE